MADAHDSARVAAARSRAAERLRRQRGLLRPLGWAMIVVVWAGAASADPAPATHGKGLAATLALCAFTATVALAIRDRFTHLAPAPQAAVIVTMGGAGTALVALQSKGATELAGAAAVWMAVVRLPLVLALASGVALTIALGLAAALSGSSPAAVIATTLLCALLGLVAYFIRQAREGEERTEVLLARLEDAREEQLRAAAIEERGRIAGELHDVLAHSLSGAAIQLQGARMLAEREQVQPHTSAAIERASELVKAGLTSARQAVSALRGDAMPGIGDLKALVESFRRDMEMDVALTVDGEARALPMDAGLALYRGAQEALTNVARYAPGASALVTLSFDERRTRLVIEDRVAPAGTGGLAGVGGGHGLDGMRERVERAGGSMRAGPTETGWRVELDVPA